MVDNGIAGTEKHDDDIHHGVFFHHSPSLFERFELDRCGSGNGSGLWANTAIQYTPSNQTLAEYAFTAPDAEFIRVGHTLPIDDFNKLLEAAEKTGDHSLAEAMRHKGQSQFIPYQHAGRDSFLNIHKAAIIEGGFDGMVTGNNTVCFIKLDKVQEFQLVRARGDHEQAIGELISKLEGMYPAPEEELISRANDGTLSPSYLDSFDRVTHILESLSQLENTKISQDFVDKFKPLYARLILSEIDGVGLQGFNNIRLVGYLIDQSESRAMFDQGTTFETDPYSENYMVGRAPQAGSFGDLKDRLRVEMNKMVDVIKRPKKDANATLHRSHATSHQTNQNTP